MYFEALYISGTKNGPRGKNGQWTVAVLSRPLENSLGNFWKVSRGRDAIPVEVETLQNIEEAVENIEIVIYVERKSAKVEEMRKLYMRYMGGNIESYCPVHKFPLTTCPQRSGNFCCNIVNNERCRRAASYECPLSGCQTFLCKLCIGTNIMDEHKDEEESVNTVQNLSEEDSSDDSSGSSSVLPSKRSEINELGNFYEDKNEEDDSFYDDISFQEEDGYEPYTNASDVHEGEMEMILPDMYLEADVMSDHSMEENSDSGSDNDSEEMHDVIPTTDASKKALDIERKGRSSRFGLHVLLNEHGTLLVRRNATLTPSRAAKGFLERIVATSDGSSIPLLYPEAMLFPSIFWNQKQDGSYDGAIPIGLWKSASDANSFGFAGIEDHMRCRLKNPSLQCSTDPRYIYFAFDSVNNVMARGMDNRVVLKRGFEHMLGPMKIRGESNDSLLSSDLVDSRRNVQKLAAMVRDSEPTYFFTHTCNQAEHFGVAPLRKYLMEEVQRLMLDTTIDDQETKTRIDALHLVMSVQIIRTWNKVGKALMDYILTSSEKPLATIIKSWWKWENQEKEGNLAHIHCLLWTLEKKENLAELEKLLDKIRCSTRTFFKNVGEVQKYVEEGLLPDCKSDTYTDAWKEIQIKLTHSCEAAKFRCMRRIGIRDNDLKCRCIDYYEENPDPTSYGYKYIRARHKPEAMKLLQKLGLFDEHERPLDNKLNSGRYVYPADYGEKMSPCNPRLFLAHKSSDNLLLTDNYFSCRYLAKYVQGIDDNYRVDVRSGKSQNTLVLDVNKTTNTKITSSRIYEGEREKKKKRNPEFSGRALGLTEVVSLILQHQQVFTDATFVSIPTVPLEQRPAHEKIKRRQWCQDIRQEIIDQARQQQPMNRGNLTFIGREVREALHLPEERQFTPMEQIIIQDSLSCPLSLDAITVYSCRPPELRFVNSPVWYLTYFKRLKHKPLQKGTSKTTTELMLNTCLWKCGWVDGLDCQILIRPKAISIVLEIEGCCEEMKKLLNTLNFYFYQIQVQPEEMVPILPNQSDEFLKLFLESKETGNLPLPLFNVVKPTETNRFLIHVLLSMGHFNNEAELFQGNSMRNFFFNAGLIPSADNVTEEEIDNLTRRFIMEQLLFVPGGTYSFDKYSVMAYNAIQNALLTDTTTCCDVPSFLYTSLVDQANETALKYQDDIRESLASCLCNLPNTPSKSELLAVTRCEPMTWIPNLTRLVGQSEDSYKECQYISEVTQNVIDCYVNASLETIKSLIICGGPGMGKTFQLSLACTYAMSRGLNVAITAVMAERANALGGRHIHFLFSLPGETTRNIHKVIDKGIRMLNRKPERLQFLRTLDVLLIDEMGYMSAELLNILDTILRCIRGKSAFMGGVLVLCTMDPQQLQPIKAKPVLLSSLIPTCFKMVEMKHSIRAKDDFLLQEVIKISRKASPTQEEVDYFTNIIIQGCRHVTSWDDPSITLDMVRIVSTRNAMAKAEEEYFLKLQKQQVGIVVRVAETVQTVVSSHGNWRKAEATTCYLLDKLVNEVEELRLHKNMVVEMTYNKPKVWCHSQMAVVVDLPTQSELDNWSPFTVYLAPVGTKKLPDGEITKFLLEQNGWKPVKVGTAPEVEHRLKRGVSAKRKQYGIRPRIAITIHRAMGGDFGSVVSCVGDGNDNYRLWEKEQVEVLISRTHKLSDLTFVGASPEDTARHLVQLLFKQSPYSLYMRHVVSFMTNQDSTEVLRPLRYLPYNLRNTVIPTQSFGFVYLLMSLQDNNTTYIGQTENLAKRLTQHNKGYGAISTKNEKLRPWSVIAFITGFNNNDKNSRKSLEKCWQTKAKRIVGQTLNPMEVIELGKYIVHCWNTNEHCPMNLNFVQCIEFKAE